MCVATVGISGSGECIARYDNYCEIDPNVVDQYGIPVLRFNQTWSDHEILQAKHMHKTFEEILTSMGGILIRSKPSLESEHQVHAPERIITEVGTKRTRNDPYTSTLNQYFHSN